MYYLWDKKVDKLPTLAECLDSITHPENNESQGGGPLMASFYVLNDKNEVCWNRVCMCKEDEISELIKEETEEWNSKVHFIANVKDQLELRATDRDKAVQGFSLSFGGFPGM